MSNPHDVAEKSVWLENNLTEFFLYGCDKDVLKDVVPIIVARMKQVGIEELYERLIAHEIEHMDEGQLDASLKDADVDPISVMERVEKMVTRDEASTVVESVITGINQAYLAGLKAQKEFDHGT
tara:strand:- start:683 stop:1054 length:372 start_codon:yes stop_codon:yes gene_type:complete